jgi:hypothetical protein
MTRIELRDRLERIEDVDGKNTAAYRSLIEIAEQILDMAESDQRSLTAWEKANLKIALSELHFGRLRLAYVALDLALTDPESVAPDAVQPSEFIKLADLEPSQYRRVLKSLSGFTPWERAPV